jgi:hypothetical protein
MRTSLFVRALLFLSLIVMLAPMLGCQQQPAPAEQTGEEGTGDAAEAQAAAAGSEPATPRAATPEPSTPRVASSEPATPPPPPPPEPIVVRLPAGTLIGVELVDELSTGTNMVGDTFTARVAQDVAYDGRVVIPMGATVTGKVDEVASAKNKKIGGRAKMVLSFETISLPTGEVPITAWVSEKGKSETPKDAAIIGGATVAGAILGHQVSDDDKGTAIGAVVGGAAGTAIAAATKGQEVTIPAGSYASLELGAPVEIRVLP